MQEQLIQSIQQSIAQNCFLDKDLSLYRMALSLNTNTSYLSKTINDIYGKRFTNFLNGNRIRYILNLLEDDMKVRTYTIEHIASLSGFNSTSAFYNAFKKFTGETPASYIAKLK